tara:strand:+ start:284 stop:427 length:144 start_codon:yes stop_codon:yes gene_type:complete
MLFDFRHIFWVGLATLAVAWISYAFLDFEFTVVTLLASMLIVLIKNN